MVGRGVIDQNASVRHMIRLVEIYPFGGVLPGAAEFLYELMKERDPEINISHRELPSFEEHWQFMMKQPFRFWYLIEAESITLPWVGYVSATWQNEIGIIIGKPYRGLGYGPAAVREFIAKHPPLADVKSLRNGHWLANIAPGNSHSKHMFEKLGFVKIQETFVLEEEKHDNRNESSTKAASTEEAGSA
jgi:RimJ/RimL family protein N-acetyltransferase